MIIDNTYFQQGELYLPNARTVDADAGTSTTQVPKINTFISEFVRELLINALGVTNYNTLKGIIDANTLGDVGNEKWAALVNGEDYTNPDGIDMRWDGLKGFSKTNSVLAYYVFCKYLRDEDVLYTTTGTVKDISKNAVSVSATPKYVNAWNKFIKLYQGGYQYVDTPRLIVNYAGEFGFDYYQQREGVFVSLMQYVYDKNVDDATNFPDAPMKLYEVKNSMGL